MHVCATEAVAVVLTCASALDERPRIVRGSQAKPVPTAPRCAKYSVAMLRAMPPRAPNPPIHANRHSRMNLYLRLLKTLVAALLGTRTHPLDERVLHMRVWPNDLDLNLHMNNGRYLTLMDLGRLDLLARAGLLRVVLRERWMPVIAGATVRFRRSLAPFERFTLHTRLVGWDARWLYLEQRFMRGGELVASAAVRAAIKGPGGTVPVERVIAASGVTVTEIPVLPDWIERWRVASENDASSRAAPTELAVTAP